MFFTKVGQVIAWGMVILGGLRAGVVFAVASSGTPELARHYLGSSSTGEAIDAGLAAVFLGISLGIATEISTSLRTKWESK